jgi:SpoVK/Ycf46/Vps4 family AAA+-type ATPase
MDSISPKSTRSQYAKQLRSEFLAQLQGVESYGEQTGNILFLICATNKPCDIDSAFLRPGRFGTKVYVGLPDDPARRYMVNKRLEKIKAKGVVRLNDDLDIEKVVEGTNGFNGSDITNLLDRIEEISIVRGIETGEKFISNDDFDQALDEINSSVQTEDLVKLKEWREENDA